MRVYNPVNVKGDGQGITFFIHEEADLQRVKDEIAERVQKNIRFFQSGVIRFHLGERTLAEQEKEELISLFQNKEQILLIEFLEGKMEKGRNRTLTASSPTDICRILEGTLRSGQKIQIGESLLINGDVNPGAEVVSSGNIYILGSLRGMAHAGSMGDASAYVYALALRPTQLRIASYIARSPDDETKNRGPEIARVRDGSIVVEPFNQ